MAQRHSFTGLVKIVPRSLTLQLLLTLLSPHGRDCHGSVDAVIKPLVLSDESLWASYGTAQGNLSTSCILTSFRPKARGKLQPVCTCSSQGLSPPLMGESWAGVGYLGPVAVVELHCHLKTIPGPACLPFCAVPTVTGSSSLLFTLDTTRVLRNSVLYCCCCAWSGRPRALQSHLWLQFLFWFWVSEVMA